MSDELHAFAHLREQSDELQKRFDVVICTIVYAVAFLFIDLALMLISWPFGPTLFWRLTVYGFFFDLGATALWLGILLIWGMLR